MFKEREQYADVLNFIPNKQYAIVTGARQVGKTSLLRALYADLKNQNEAVFYLSFEDPFILAAINKHPDHVFDYIAARPKRIIEGQSERRIFLLIDEIQYAQDPSNFLKFLYDTYENNLKIVATGSSAFYIDRKFKDSLAGRKRIFRLNTLNFREFLVFQDREDLCAELDLSRERPEYRSPQTLHLRHFFWDYLRFGGYPAVALEGKEREKKLILDELKNAYVRRDVLESKITNEIHFYTLLKILAEQTGNLMNKNDLSNELKLDAKTVDNYISILEKCFHISLLRPFFTNLRKELTKMPKVFFNDLGLRNVLVNRFDTFPDRADKGALLENYFFLRLNQKYDAEQIFFWHTTTGQEVDFVIRDTLTSGKAYEIKWSENKIAPNKYTPFTDVHTAFPLSFLTSEDYMW
jgi:uncharacterized protein